MTSKNPASSRQYDVRITERNIKQGVLTRKELEKHLETLPDVASKSISLGEVERQRGSRAGTDDLD